MVSYPGPWRLSWQGTNATGAQAEANAIGSQTGQGSYSTVVFLSGLDTRGLTLCAQATKLDGSGRILTLTIYSSKNTTAPYGSVGMCNTVAP